MGKQTCGGLGAGGDPSVGEECAEETEDELRDELEGADMVFVTCGLGGGTGTGSAPIIAKLAKKAGATTIVGIDPIAQRRELAEKYGADYTLDPMKADVGFRLKELTDKRGVDSVIETSGSAAALQASLRGIGYGGIISYVAFAKPFPAGFNLGREAHFNNAKIVFARASSEPNPDYPRWNRKRIEDTCWELLMNGYLDCEEIIDPVVPFAESAEAYMRYVDQHPEESIKMGVQVQGGEQ